jgi:hypothetical protein
MMLTPPSFLNRLAWQLQPGQACTWQLQPGEVLRVDQGRLWLTRVTRVGDAQDHVIPAGQGWQAMGCETVVVESFGPGPCQGVRRLGAQA